MNEKASGTTPNNPIRQVDLTQIDETTFERRFVSCIVLTQDNKILLQQRGSNWRHFPGFLSTFGGSIEPDELPMQALIRELKEELGAHVIESDVISFGAITEDATKHRELIYVYFWHDKHGTISGCYEGEPRYYDDCEAVFSHPKLIDDVRWLLKKCQGQFK